MFPVGSFLKGYADDTPDISTFWFALSFFLLYPDYLQTALAF